MNNYTILQKLMTSKLLNEGTRRAVRERLKIILENDVREFQYWQDAIKEKLNKTRQKQVERVFNKKIQAFKIVIHHLTPFFERLDDIPSIIVKKHKK